MKDKPVVMYESDEAAVHETRSLTGWWSADGRFWGDSEGVARYAGSTHRKCECGEIMEKHYTKCKECRHKATVAKYDTLERVPYEGQFLTDYDGDRYYWSFDDVLDAIEAGELSSDPLLVIAEEHYGRPIDVADLLCDDLPEDGDLPLDLIDAERALNKAIKDAGPLSYMPSNKVPKFSEQEIAQMRVAAGEQP